MKDLIIFGAGPFAELAHYYFERDSGYKVAAFTLDSAFLSESNFQGRPVVPFETLEKEFPPERCDLFVARGIQKVNRQRATKAAEAREKGYALASFLSSKAIAPAELILRPNSFVMEGVHVMPFVTIGWDTMIWPGSVIGFKSRIGDHCWLVATTFGESVTVGDYTFIGLGSTIAPSLSIGSENVIGAGSLIMKDTKDFEVFKGEATVPSRVPSYRLRRI
jgi:sugar O-acyltransferase (sialic acid O-acetyltransferase NeuD family)